MFKKKSSLAGFFFALFLAIYSIDLVIDLVFIGLF